MQRQLENSESRLAISLQIDYKYARRGWASDRRQWRCQAATAVAYAVLGMCYFPYYLRVLSALLYIGMALSLGDGRPGKVSAGKALAL